MYLSGCSSILKYASIMKLAPFERLKVTDSSYFQGLWEEPSLIPKPHTSARKFLVWNLGIRLIHIPTRLTLFIF